LHFFRNRVILIGFISKWTPIIVSEPKLPILVEPRDLADKLELEDLLIVDLSDGPIYARHHIPGAVRLEYSKLLASRPPVMGLLPAEKELAATLAAIGLTPDTHVVAYDNETNNKACRFLWTLDVVGHQHFSLLNGGLKAWLALDLPVTDEVPPARPGHYEVHYGKEHCADKEYILAHLDDPEVVILDTRSAAEYAGSDKRAFRAGHIPGAVNVEWTQAIDRQNDMKFKPAEELRAIYEAAGVTPDKEIIVHCQTHQRSSHTYMVLKSLAYPRIKGYPGSWSEWGNDPDTPIETE